MLRFLPYLLAACLLYACGPTMPPKVAEAYNELPEVIDYNFHVKPILSDRCYACHGPDENSRKANFRLDLEDHAFAVLESGGHAFKAGSPGSSKAIDRMVSADPSEVMPPPESKLTLTPTEIATLVKWVEQGAEWKPHWSFTPPAPPSIPDGFPEEWKTLNPVDHFIYEKLNQEGLKPAPPADKERLLRRLSFDLTGLPPSTEEMDAFLQDNTPEAYEKQVDRLLASEHYGERLAMEWMDVARYADSHGLHADGWRLMWPWRDWVIKAFNQNMSYKDFVTWQLAGDLMPDATNEQVLATAFHRNHPMTAEGGVVDEEFRLEYVADRTNTTATAFLGLTMECAKCHDHKFDPILQEEYYMMSAFFNNVKELGMTGDDGNYGPMLLMTSAGDQEKINAVEERIRETEKALEVTTAEVNRLTAFVDELKSPAQILGLVGHYPFESTRSAKVARYNTYQGDNPPHMVEQRIFDGNKRSYSPGTPEISPGRVGNAVTLAKEYDEVYLSGVGIFELHEPYSGSAWINTVQADTTKTQVVMGTAGEKNNFWRGWDLYLDEQNRLNARLIHSLPHNYLHVTSSEVIETNQWHHVGFTYDGSGRAAGLSLFINGQQVAANIAYDKLYKSITPVRVFDHKSERRPVRVGKSYRGYTGENGIYYGQIDEIRLYNRNLSALEMGILAGEEDLPTQAKRDHALKRDPRYRAQLKELNNLRKDWLALIKDIPEVMVMEEMSRPRPTHLLARGEYNSPIKQVAMGTPERVMSFPDDLPKNRLGLSQWIFDERNPLTARVTVNRYWQMIYGRGLVKTVNDFGAQGALPSHPELLDWLALEFINSGWDVKLLLKTIVMSAVYQQASKATEELKEKDPENVFLARAPSYRWPAEMIRDNALAASGLLSRTIGGESVKPYQPEGLWIELGSFSHRLYNYKEDSGEDLYRRSLYTFIRRTSPPPYMTTFDAPSRDVCTVQRERTNTPLQALVLLNDPQFVEASRVLAERIQRDSSGELKDEISTAFRLATGRNPGASEMKVFLNLYLREYDRFSNNKGETTGLLTVGEFRSDDKLDPVKTASLAIVASTMFNHDEAYMRR